MNKLKYQKTDDLRDKQLMINLTRITRMNSEEHQKGTIKSFLKRQSMLKSDKKNEKLTNRPSFFFLEKEKSRKPSAPLAESNNLQIKNEGEEDDYNKLSAIKLNVRIDTLKHELSIESSSRRKEQKETTIIKESTIIKEAIILKEPIIIKENIIKGSISSFNKPPNDINSEPNELSISKLEVSNERSEKQMRMPKSYKEILDDEDSYYFNDKNCREFKLILDKEKDEDYDKNVIQILKPNSFMLFSKKQNDLSEVLKEEINELYAKENTISLIIFQFCYVCKTFAMVFWAKSSISVNDSSYIFIIVMRSLFIMSLFVLSFKMNLLLQKKYFKWPLLISFSLGFVINVVVSFWLEEYHCYEIEIIELMMIYLVLLKISVVYFLDALIIFILLFVVKVLCMGFQREPYLFINIIFFMFGCVMLMQSYSRLSKLTKNFNNLNITNYRQNQQKKLLMHLLPKHVYF